MHTEKARHEGAEDGRREGAVRSTRSRKRPVVQGNFGHHRPAPATNEVARRGMSHVTSFQPHTAPLPIWFAALDASNCSASGEGGEHSIRWFCESGRALYRNEGSHAEWIESLGVGLGAGDILSVTWVPGDTSYTVEILQSLNYVA
jgi:hypothetical protein